MQSSGNYYAVQLTRVNHVLREAVVYHTTHLISFIYDLVSLNITKG